MLKAKILKLNPLIEEEVLLEVNGIRLVGFTTICPYKIMQSNVYPVRLFLVSLDGLEAEVLNEKEYDATRVDDSYGYILKGQVVYGNLDIGNDIIIRDDYFDENSFLNGKYVLVKINRLGVEFL